MKKTQTIVDRERLGSDYIESKQDFSNVLSQVTQLPTSTWNSPWFYGPIGIAVFAVTISIVSLNPSSAKATNLAIVDKTSKKTESTEKKVVIEKVVVNNETTAVSILKNNNKKDSKINIISPSESEIAAINKEEVKSQLISNAEVAPVSIKKIAANNKYPHIEGVFTGEIVLSDLFSENGIQLNQDVKIVSFDFNYFNGKSNVVKRIDGNIIPPSLHSTIEAYNIGQMIFITNIKAVDDMSRLFTLPSINYKPINN